MLEEIDALKKGKGGSVVSVFNGRSFRETFGLFIYLSHMKNFPAAMDDIPAGIEIGGNRYSCQVVSAQGLGLQVGLENS